MNVSWLGTLRARNVLTFSLALFVSQALVLLAFGQWVIAPRARVWGETLAQQVLATQAALLDLPAAQRQQVAGRLGVLPDRVGAISATGRAVEIGSSQVPMPMRAVARSLQAALGDRHDVSYDSASTALVVRFEVDGLRLYQRLSVREPKDYMLRSTALVVVAAVAISLLLAALVQWHLARPLQRLRLAAGQPPGEPLQRWRRHNDPAEIVEVLDELERRGAELMRLNAERLLLLAGVSHDVRTPLAKLRLALEMAHEMAPQRRLDMKRYLGQADDTLQQFLAVARGELVEASQEVDIAGLCRQAASRFDRSGRESATEPWRVEAPVTLMARVRPVMMRRLIDNLLDNACTYGQPPRTLILRTTSTRIVLQVTDEGPGIAPALHEQALSPFVRLSAPLDSAGSGLGLAIARQIALMHSGGLRLSVPDHGRGLMVEAWIPIPPAGASPPAN